MSLLIAGSLPAKTPKNFYQSVYQRTLPKLGLTDKTKVELSLVDYQTMRRLNKKYSGDDYATDVLSFSYQAEADGGEPTADDLLGEIVICTEIAKINAKAHNVTFSQELVRLLVHGLIHLTGKDHDKAGRARFDRLENDIMREISSQVLS